MSWVRYCERCHLEDGGSTYYALCDRCGERVKTNGATFPTAWVQVTVVVSGLRPEQRQQLDFCAVCATEFIGFAQSVRNGG